MKILAKQIPPEYQESPLFIEGFWPENVATFGNRDYKERTFPLFDKTREALFHYNNGLLDWWDTFQCGNSYGETWEGILNDLVPPIGREAYTRHERKNIWPELALRADSLKDQPRIMVEALELITGKKWATATIRGCCQGDWQEIIYPAEYGREWLNVFEIEYFNTGTEWQLDPDGDNISCYVTAWKTEDIKKELADAYGCKPEEITLLKFSGYTRSANWEEE